MPERNSQPLDTNIQPTNDIVEAGFVHITAESNRISAPDTQQLSAMAPAGGHRPAGQQRTPATATQPERSGTPEHLALRRTLPMLDPTKPEIKELLRGMRAEITRQMTAYHWEGQTVTVTADALAAQLNVGNVEQWKHILIPFFYEIDRGGVLLPIWIELIFRGDPVGLPLNANPAETPQGRVRRFAVLMLGNYKTIGIRSVAEPRWQQEPLVATQVQDVARFLGHLATDPSISFYATQALLQQENLAALQALVTALEQSHGWARVDVVEALLSLHKAQFYPLIINSGLDAVPGLESYITTPIYHTIPLGSYLAGQWMPNNGRPTLPTNADSQTAIITPFHLQQQAALILHQVLLDSLNLPLTTGEEGTIPLAFQQDLAALMIALWEGARQYPCWQSVITLHRLCQLVGRYWQALSQHQTLPEKIRIQIEPCLVKMYDIEAWMKKQGRATLLAALLDPAEERLLPVIRVLQEMQEPQLEIALVQRLHTTTAVQTRTQAFMISAICDVLSYYHQPGHQPGHQQVNQAQPMMPTNLDHATCVEALQQLAERVIDISGRQLFPRLSDNLPNGNEHIPGSIVYTAVLRALGTMRARVGLENALQATLDMDPYVRSIALETIGTIDERGEDKRSRIAVRQALQDPSETVINAASQVIIRFQDYEALPLLQELATTRPELTTLVQTTLRALTIGQKRSS